MLKPSAIGIHPGEWDEEWIQFLLFFVILQLLFDIH